MTLAELRLIEEFLDFCAERGVPLAEARLQISARILGSELHELLPERDMQFFEKVCVNFLAER